MTRPDDTQDLRDVLLEFASRITTAGQSREGVSVEVTRREGFQNDATTPKGHSLALDEPVHMGGKGLAPDPAEYLLSAIGASFSVTLTVHAALLGYRVDAIEVKLAAEIDGRPFFDPDGGGTAGLLDMVLELRIASPEPTPLIEDLVDRASRAAPVLQTLKHMPRISLQIESS